MKQRLLELLQEEKEMKLKGGLYHQTQIKLKKGYLMDTCLSAQDQYAATVAYFFQELS